MGKITKSDFVKVGTRYLLKNSNAIYVSEQELERIVEDNSYLDAMIDITSNECQGKKKNATKSASNNSVKKTRTVKE